MALNIANHKVEEKAILASHILGTNKTAAVEHALDYYLEHHRPAPRSESVIKEVSRLLDELAELPLIDKRDVNEIIGYNKDGLPCE